MEAETATEMTAVATAATAAGIAIEMIAAAGVSMTFVRHTCPLAYLSRTIDVCIWTCRYSSRIYVYLYMCEYIQRRLWARPRQG